MKKSTRKRKVVNLTSKKVEQPLPKSHHEQAAIDNMFNNEEPDTATIELNTSPLPEVEEDTEELVFVFDTESVLAQWEEEITSLTQHFLPIAVNYSAILDVLSGIEEGFVRNKIDAHMKLLDNRSLEDLAGTFNSVMLWKFVELLGRDIKDPKVLRHIFETQLTHKKGKSDMLETMKKIMEAKKGNKPSADDIPEESPYGIVGRR